MPPAASPALLARALLLALVLALLGGCATATGRNDALQKSQYAWSAAIRWGDIEGAWNLVDPAYRDANPLTDTQLERYKQLRISAYRELGTQASPDGDSVTREVELGVINNHTLAERSVRVRERWRWDAEKKAWWVDGLPDLWAGE